MPLFNNAESPPPLRTETALRRLRLRTGYSTRSDLEYVIQSLLNAAKANLSDGSNPYTAQHLRRAIDLAEGRV